MIENKLFKSSFCVIPLLLSIIYLVLLVDQQEWLLWEMVFLKYYMPGFVFAILILPSLSYFLWKKRESLVYIDLSLFFVPLFLWLIFLPKGSFFTFLFINPPVIGTLSLLYLSRFLKKTEVSLLETIVLWLLISAIIYVVIFFIPIVHD